MPTRPTIMEHYDKSRCLLPELDRLGYDFYPAAQRHLEAHVHSNVYEICYISKGEVNWWVGSEVYHVGKGDLYITRPREEHGGVDAMIHASEFYYLQIRLPVSKPLPGLDRAQSRALVHGFGSLRHRCFAAAPVVGACFKKLLATQRKPEAFSMILARAALHELLVQVLHDHKLAMAQRGGRASDKSQLIRDAMKLINTHLDEDWRVEDIASAVGLGVSRFHERFLNEVGFSPNDYRTRKRIENAKQMLKTSDFPVIDIAMRLGFSTSQYFATVFRKQTGMTPRAYRELVQDTAGELE